MKSNLDPKVAGALCYVPWIGWIVAIVMLLIEKNADVRFNAAQSIVLGLGSMVLSFVLMITVILSPISFLLGIAVFVLNLVLAIKTYQGSKMVLPVIGPWAEKLLGKVSSK